MTIIPVRDRILVRRDDAETVSKGGIILPDSSSARERPCKGTVLAVGPGRLLVSPMGQPLREPMSCEVGDQVIFTKYAGDGYKFSDQELFLVKEEDLVAVIAPDPEPEDPYTADELIEEYETVSRPCPEPIGSAFSPTGQYFEHELTEAARVEAIHADTVGYLAYDPDQHSTFHAGLEQPSAPLTVFRPDRDPEHMPAGR